MNQQHQPQPVEDTLLDVHSIAHAIANRTAHLYGGRERTVAFLEALVDDAERALEAARRALEVRRIEVETSRPPTLFPVAPVAELRPEAPERERLPVERSRISRCRAATCQAPMVYLHRAGKPHPVDAGTVRLGETHFDPKLHTSHFSTCPEASRFRGEKA